LLANVDALDGRPAGLAAAKLATVDSIDEVASEPGSTAVAGSLPQQYLAPLDNHRQLSQRPGDIGKMLRQGRQFPFDRLGGHSRGQQFRQTSGSCHFLKIEIG
jgi:hypothetical protein